MNPFVESLQNMNQHAGTEAYPCFLGDKSGESCSGEGLPGGRRKFLEVKRIHCLDCRDGLM